MDPVVTLDMLVDSQPGARVLTPSSASLGGVDVGQAQPDRLVLPMADSLVDQTLAWVAEMLGTRTARMLRPLHTGGWLVTAHRRDGLLTYPADDSEVAMAWMVALGRQPLTVTRPRVTMRDGSGVRPISAKTYLGVPVICQDELVGVIEVAGDLPDDSEDLLNRAHPRLSNVAQRLVHDPALHAGTTDLSLTMRVRLAGSIWCRGDVELNGDELRFVAAIDGSARLDDIREATSFSADYVFDLTRSLINRGLIALDRP